MRRKHWLIGSIALGMTFLPSFIQVHAEQSHSHSHADTHITTIDKFGQKVQIGDALPKAKTIGKEKFDQPAKIESNSTAVILNEKKQVVGQKQIKKNTASNKVTAAATRTVTVLVTADEEYRAAHPDWQTLTANIVENADNGFQRDHAIDFQVQAYGNWTSSGSNSSAILSDLDRDWNTGQYDFLVGFTKDANFDAGGIAYVYSSAPAGSAVSVNLDQGATATWHAAQHEFSHNFANSHDPQGSGIQCIMNYDYSYSVDFWDQAHDDQIELNEGWYGF
ncbi:zinc-dependent metalloprotease [Laceyella putida]|uniref:Zinc-dependent metalloprotease n=1 Tax=Laceyella putida TaxID=110101 RepID=A0ABW2RH51_9BACL